MSAEDFARLAARIAGLQALAPTEGFRPVSDEAAATARRIARAMVAMGRKPHFYATHDDAADAPPRGGCTVECDEVDVYINADGRIASVVTLAEGDDDDDG